MSKKEVVQLHGNLHNVPVDLIAYSDDTEQSFFNPRWAMNLANGAEARGMGDEKMDELREAIRTDGLQHPLVVRSGKNVGNQKMTLLNGERRKRCIDRLIEDGDDCYDASTGKWVPAATLYSMIECRILSDIDDKKAYKLAFSGNDSAVDIGDQASVLMVRQWRQAGYSDGDIQEITGKKSPTWLRDSDAICKLDKKCFEAFVNGEVNRTVAIRLSEEPDIQQRLVKLAETRRLAAERIQKLVEHAEQSLDKAEEQRELAEARIELLTQEGGTAVAVREAKAKQEQADSNLSKKKKLLNHVRNRRVTGGQKDLNGAVASLSINKIRKHHIEPLNDLIEQNPELADKARLLKHWWASVSAGETDIVHILETIEI